MMIHVRRCIGPTYILHKTIWEEKSGHFLAGGKGGKAKCLFKSLNNLVI